MTRKPKGGDDSPSAKDAKASVHEAIGILLGDDVARATGKADQRAGTKPPPASSPKSPRR